MSEKLRFLEPGRLEETRYEKLHIVIFDSPEKASLEIADAISSLIQKKQKANQPCVLGLATGNSPLNIYRELVRKHKEDGLSFRNVITFNLDEYFPMDRLSDRSYHHFMRVNLFDHVDIPSDQIHIPDGSLDRSELIDYCRAYESKIKEVGGIDLQLLGIGRTGHIGFNEPGSHSNSRTRLITLDHLTRSDAAKGFGGLENVPRRAITMGIRTILEARCIYIMAWGNNKAKIVREAVEGDKTSIITASYLQGHKNTTFIVDVGAASELTRLKTPWEVRQVDWTEQRIAHAVTWLCQRTKKSILKLTDEDYNQNSLSGLLSQHGPSYDLNIRMFNKLQRTITGWPGGKPYVDDTHRPERSLPAVKRSIIFSPHPDDDVISMGGTFDRLVAQGNEVHIAYQTSGSIAVSDQDAVRYLEVMLDTEGESLDDTLVDLVKSIRSQQLTNEQFLKLLKLKGIIRKRESIGATRYLGLPDHQVHFLNLPFYETGKIEKNPPSDKDTQIVIDLIEKIKPHQIFAAGDLTDPHGTHRVCLNIIFEALEILKSRAYMKDCWVWLYRGAWEEWETHEIDMAVPMSPDQVLRKRQAIFFHESQKDGVMFQGDDDREFWVRAEDRNKKTAVEYRLLGLSDYAAMEAFKRYNY